MRCVGRFPCSGFAWPCMASPDGPHRTMQVHEEVLRLLLAAAPQLPVPQTAQYLHNTINNSKKSRK